MAVSFVVAMAADRTVYADGADKTAPAAVAKQRYVLQVFKVDVQPTKLDGHIWDGTQVLKDLPSPKGITTGALVAAAAKKIVELGLDATVAPDLYVVVEAGKKNLQTTTQQDTYQAAWEAAESSMTAAIGAGDTLKISVIDKDLSVNDPVGATLHTVTADELSAGFVEVKDFDQVLSVQVTLTAIGENEILYSPGRYKVIVHGATIAAKKPPRDTNAGKAWDALGGDPDIQGEVTIGGVGLVLPKQQDTLKPVWDLATEIDLDATSSLSARFIDRDLSGDKGDDRVGAIWSSVLLAEAPAEDGRIHLSDHAAVTELTIELLPVAAPVTAAECRALASHAAAVAEAAGDAKLAASLKAPKPEDLRACVVRTTRAQFDCSIAATDLDGLATCSRQ